MNGIQYSPRARREFREFIGYVRRQDPIVAAAIANAVIEAVERLANEPRLGTPTSAHNLRRYPIRRYGITIYVRHRPRKQVLEVVRIVRGKRVKRLERMP